jgi:Ser/Thr protein kinase RdoA (MazF antagonist)
MPDRGIAEDAPEALREAASAALRRWNKRASEIHLVKMRENAVLRVVDQDGAAFALRIHRRGNHSDEALRSELQWIAALGEAGIEVPALVPAVGGGLFEKVRVASGAPPRQVDLFEWIDGRQLGTSAGGLAGDLPDVASVYHAIGCLMAGLHDHAATWPLPEGFRRHRWDLDGLVGERPLWGRFWELEALTHAERRLLVHARARVRQELQALAAEADAARHYGLIHADLVPENVLLAPDGRLRLIDFDDGGFGWHPFELATALYFLQDDPGYDAAKAGLLDGYRSRRDLPASLLARLPAFMAARGFTYLGWAHTRPGSKEGQAMTPHLVRLACRTAERLLG